ncbi:MAG: hypothetical protein JNK66_01970 [Chitinophagales bacterium]|nr:hypothetical protein [Chitinophagales bacterium]
MATRFVRTENAISASSCQPSKPFINLGDGNAPTLDYNLPQRTCTKLVARIPLNIDTANFLPAYADIEDPWYNEVNGRSVQELVARLEAEITGGGNREYLISGFGALVNAAAPVVFINSGDTPEKNQNIANGAYFYFKSSNGYARVIFMTGNVFSTLKLQDRKTTDVAQAIFKEVSFTVTPVVIDIVRMAENMALKKKPTITTASSGLPQVSYIGEPTYNPRAFLLLDLQICSYLGNYGAGRTLKTFSLLPGEKTTISIRTYKDTATTSSRADSFIDSYSEAASLQIQSMLNKEQGKETSVDVNMFTSHEADVHVEASGLIKSVAVAGSANYNFYTSSDVTTHVATVEKTMSSLAAASAREANTYRQNQVNTTTQSTTKEGEENSTIRILENTNWSRTLNFVFRELLQEYIIVNTIKDVRILITNGNEYGTMVCNVWDLHNALSTVIVPTEVNNVHNKIIDQCCKFRNYQGNNVDFLEQVNVVRTSCTGGAGVNYPMWQRKRNINDTIDEGGGGFNISTDGVILSYQRQILKTDSVIVDALLGQGEALDCYNQQLQNAAAIRAQLENAKTELAIDALQQITDPTERIAAYRKAFGNCCEDKNMNIGPVSLNVTSTNYDNTQP